MGARVLHEAPNRDCSERANVARRRTAASLGTRAHL